MKKYQKRVNLIILVTLYYNSDMKATDVIKNLVTGFWQNGFIALCKIVLQHWILSSLVVILIAYLCADSATEVYAWFLIGIFAVYSAIKAIIEILAEIRKYLKSKIEEEKTSIIQKIGGKIFDFILCVIGIFQALKIFSHVSKVTKSASSAINVVDDVAGAISKFLKDFKR